MSGFSADHALTEALFDTLPDVVFFLKDQHGRYVRVNQTLADRCAGGDKARLVGSLPGEVFPAPLAASYERQDAAVLRTGKPVQHQLELHLYPGGRAGWCLTTKHPLRDTRGRIIGLAGISRDLNAPAENAPGFQELAAALHFMKRHFHEALRMEEIARQAGLSLHQFESRVRRLFQMSPMQLLHKLRLDEGIRLLRDTDDALAEIALRTGWCDQSAFTRHFSRCTGLSPGRYRQLHRTA